MRVLVMLPSYPPHQCIGSYVMTHTLLRALLDRGHQADVVLSETVGEPYELDGVRVWPHRHKADPFEHLDAANVLIAHAGASNRAAALSELHGVPLVLIAHDTSPHTAAVLAKRPAALTVYNSRHMADEFGPASGDSLIIRPPVRVEDYQTTPGDCVTLVNLSDDKGAAVFYALAERFPDVPFLGVEGGYGIQWTKRGPDDLPNVDTLPHVPAGRMRDEVYARTRILLMPSAKETWGRVGVEAMCSGIPVIAHPTEGLRESLGDAGVFVDRGDLDGWAAALKGLLDKRRWPAASRRAKARAAEINPAAELGEWCAAMERLAMRRLRTPRDRSRDHQ